MFTHVVIILWIFLKGRLLNARFACLLYFRAPTVAAQLRCVFAERDFTLIAPFPVGIKGKRSNIYCLGCHGLQDKHGLGIVYNNYRYQTVSGGKKAKELIKASSCPDVCSVFGSTNVTST